MFRFFYSGTLRPVSHDFDFDFFFFLRRQASYFVDPFSGLVCLVFPLKQIQGEYFWWECHTRLLFLR